MDKIQKTLEKLSAKEQGQIKDILKRMCKQQFTNLDIKKLKGREDIFRVRKGGVRIIYRKDKNGKIFILAIERRTNTTYKF